MGKIVRTKYSQSEWPKILGLVAAGSRMGSMWSALLYGSILRTGISSAGLLGAMGLGAAQGSWRAIYKVSAVMQVITLHCTALYLYLSLFFPLHLHWLLLQFLTHLFLHQYITVQGGALLAYVLCDKLLLSDSPSFIQRQSTRLKQQLNSRGQGQDQGSANQVTVDSAAAAAVIVGAPVSVPESLSQVLRRISTDRRFWLMLAGKVALMTVGQFISFIPLYLRTGTAIPLYPTKGNAT